MSDTPAAVVRLFSWIRQGLQAGIASGVPRVGTSGHLAVPLRVRVNDGSPIDVPVELYGPGDVTGIDPREVIRTDPSPFSTDFEPNYFPLIEFDWPDLPWMFTPAGADGAGHLQPWICLAVVRRAAASISVIANRPLPVLECSRADLPDLADAWAWAHAQIVEGTTPVMDPALDAAAQSRALDEMLKRSPERSLSRLLCPRRLDPSTAYYACVVPTFDIGRKAGLGDEVTADDERALKPAWGSPEDPPKVRLPIYFHWEFSTGIGGDFEALARRLVPRTLPTTVGLRPMDITSPGWGMPALDPREPGGVLGLEGALRAPDTEPTPWPEAARQPYQTSLREILNAPADQTPAASEPSIVGPPLYGQWHAKQRTVPDAEEPPHWFRELNLDPRHRAAAGLGTAVIRFEQEQLMASAWEQLARYEQDQERLKRAQLSEAVGQVLGEKHFEPLPLDRFFQVTAPLRRTAIAARAAAAAPQPQDAAAAPLVSAAFRRLSRSAGPVARRADTAARALGAASLSDSGAARTPGRRSAIRAVAAAPGARAASESAARLRTMRTAVLRDIDSTVSVPEALRQDLPQAESTDLIRFAPQFPQPMYEPLRDYVDDALLPGLEQVPSNTITLLETNPRFIEAYMVGLNHEMSRELLWRGFPTDQRGTYFRQFWDIRGRVPPPATDDARAALADIAALTSWSQTSRLGENSSGGSSEGQLVLLLRGELLRRYPRAIVYAAEAVWSADRTRRELGTAERYPLFRATRQPDVTMLGFPLTDVEARGADTGDGHPGWFFVLQEQPTEPRFGLDVATTFGGVPARWSDLSWGDLAADQRALEQLAHVPLDGPLEGKVIGSVPWARNSAHMAFITRQPPFRVAVHARTWLTRNEPDEE